jgi:hypothetical protein
MGREDGEVGEGGEVGDEAPVEEDRIECSVPSDLCVLPDFSDFLIIHRP